MSIWELNKNCFWGRSKKTVKRGNKNIIVIESEMIIISRIARKYLDSTFFHVIIQGINKEYIFKEDKFKKVYLQQINRFSNELKINIIAYCIMDNHAHFLIKSNSMENLSKLMQKVNSMYAKYYNYIKNRVGYVFRDRFLSEPIDSKRYFIECIKYIHQNPIKAGIVNDCKDYEYSSYHNFINWCAYDELIINELLTKQEYQDICNNYYCESNFIDIDEEKNLDEIIKYGIKRYLKINEYKIYDIYSNREILKELIKFLKLEYKIKYVQTQKFFDIKKGTMEGLKTYK